jgi:hypothetical protein
VQPCDESLDDAPVSVGPRLSLGTIEGRRSSPPNGPPTCRAVRTEEGGCKYKGPPVKPPRETLSLCHLESLPDNSAANTPVKSNVCS